VTATLVASDGARFVGRNDCRLPQRTCPRGEMPHGVGYHLCREVCDQPAHAEVGAIRQAGGGAVGATIYVEGHDKACSDCSLAAWMVGASIVMGPPPGSGPLLPVVD